MKYLLACGPVSRFLISKGFHRFGSPELLRGSKRGRFMVSVHDDEGNELRVEHCDAKGNRAGVEETGSRRQLCGEYAAALNERFDARFIDTEDGGFVLVTTKKDGAS